MEKEKFYKMLDNKEYNVLEENLKEEYLVNKNPEIKYQLGICYSEQFNKIEDAKKIFKELLNTDYRPPYVFFFIAKCTKDNIEKIKILKEGLRIHPDSIMLDNQLLFYLEGEEKEQKYKELEKKNVLKVSSIMEMISYYFKIKEFSKANKLFKKNEEQINAEKLNKRDIELIKILMCYLDNKNVDLEEVDSLIVSDNNTINGTILRLIEIDIIVNKNVLEAKKLLRQVSYREEYPESFLELVNFSDNNFYYFSLEEILTNIINKLDSKFENEEEKRKLRIIKLLHCLYWNENYFNKSQIKSIEKDLREELKSTESVELYSFLLEIYGKLGDNKKYFKAYLNFIEMYRNKEDIIIEFDNFNESELNYVIEYICNHIKISSFNANKYQELIENLIKELHNRKKYNEVVRIISCIDFKKLNYLNFGFEIAYAYKKQKMDKESKKIYEEYINKYPKSSAAINNLGLIYENEGNIEKALELYKKSDNISHDSIVVNNIKRCNELIEESKKEKEKSYGALASFEKENIYVVSKLKLFYSNCDENYNVICSYNRLPKLLNCDEVKAQELLNRFLDNNYIFKNKDHNYDTNSSVYKINIVILERIQELDKENEIVTNFTNCLNNFSIKNLKKLDYTETFQKLSEIKDDKIKNIFIRDYNELVYNYLSNQSKSVILMSGTIIELLLLYILELNNISQYGVGYKCENKKVDEMNISEMLEVCTNEKLIHNTPQKFIDGVKNFRNFIHPGKELREKILDIDKQTVDLLMSIVRWLILTIDFN